MSAPGRAYSWIFLDRPAVGMALLLALLAFWGYHARDFRLDASADSLVLESDPDLLRLREISARYGSQALLVVTFTPDGPLFSDAALQRVGALRNDLASVGGVASVLSLLDAPLISSADVPLTELASKVPTLESPTVDRERARQELLSSPVFRELLISADGQTTALLLDLRTDPQLATLERRRNELVGLREASGLSAEQARELRQLAAAVQSARAGSDAAQHRQIAAIRAVIDRHRDQGRLHLGGIPMIADDMISFVRSDLVVFGAGVLVFLVLTLTIIFRQPRWVLLPLVSCFYAGLTMLGVLGLIGWPVTVISSNFLALMLIITISMNIHLAVRYRQLRHETPDEPHRALVGTTLRRMVWPCLYTALTTILGFASLVVSDIKPVQDFGWIMSTGLAVVFLTSFTLFPALLMLSGKPRDPGPVTSRESWLPGRLADLTERHGSAILAVSALVALLSAVGISQLTVENSFIDYFSEKTEIYQGMVLIDQKLGGTTPLEVLLHFDPAARNGGDDPAGGGTGVAGAEPPVDDLEDEEDWLDEYDVDVAAGPEYWFTASKVQRVKQVHDYLDSLPEVGKVLSLASLIRVAEERNDGRELGGLELGVLYKKLPADLRERLVNPYFSSEADEARIMLRILDSRPDLRRAELLARIESGLRDLGLGEDEVTISGTMVLYNNMLQSLYRSQVSSLGAVLLGVLLMFAVLFRSVSLSIIGIVPNILAAGAVLGLMGLVGIPLDMMTITIAAITIGIAVDNAIHYIYRFREEFEKTGDYARTLHECHSSIGRAVLYTSATIVFGFSILVLSNFLPTIYFGLLTALAIAVALLASLTLLPRLILVWRPFPRP